MLERPSLEKLPKDLGIAVLVQGWGIRNPVSKPETYIVQFTEVPQLKRANKTQYRVMFSPAFHATFILFYRMTKFCYGIQYWANITTLDRCIILESSPLLLSNVLLNFWRTWLLYKHFLKYLSLASDPCSKGITTDFLFLLISADLPLPVIVSTFIKRFWSGFDTYLRIYSRLSAYEIHLGPSCNEALLYCTEAKFMNAQFLWSF